MIRGVDLGRPQLQTLVARWHSAWPLALTALAGPRHTARTTGHAATAAGKSAALTDQGTPGTDTIISQHTDTATHIIVCAHTRARTHASMHAHTWGSSATHAVISSRSSGGQPASHRSCCSPGRIMAAAVVAAARSRLHGGVPWYIFERGEGGDMVLSRSISSHHCCQ